jgi:hypothetical protein
MQMRVAIVPAMLLRQQCNIAVCSRAARFAIAATLQLRVLTALPNQLRTCDAPASRSLQAV